jgi:hypothetical protein
MDAIESRFVSFWETTKNGSNPTFTASLRARKDFINPYILERVVDRLKIDEYGSNFLSTTKRSHAPDEYSAENFYNVLRELEAASVTEDSMGGSALASVTSVGVTKEMNRFHDGSDPKMCELSNFSVINMELPPHTSPNQQGGYSFDCSRVQKKSRWQ